MTDSRESDAGVVLASLRDNCKICTSAAEAARLSCDYVVAEATTHKDFRTLSPTQELPRLRLIILRYTFGPPIIIRSAGASRRDE
jgi:hypothetical protein